MNDLNSNSPLRAQSGFSVVALIAFGFWLVVSPFVIDFAISASLWNTLLAGAVLLLLTLLRVSRPGATGLMVATVLVGVWLIAAPFLFDYLSMGMFWNSTLVGLLTLAFAIASRGAVRVPLR